MPCLLCGDICRCSSDGNISVSPLAINSFPEGQGELELPVPVQGVEELGAQEQSEPGATESQAWRQELAERLNRYHAKHKPRPPRYPSLRLRFEEPASATYTNSGCDELGSQQDTGASSHNALALDRFANCAAAPAVHLSRQVPATDAGEDIVSDSDAAGQLNSAPQTAKILEFPRSWTPPPPPVDELAEPVTDRPRILEAPEFVPPPPALGGITIEPTLQPDLEKRPGIDIPLQSAPLLRRICSAAIDSVIIATACGLFGFIFWKMTAIEPPKIQMAGIGAGLFATLWAAYQYLLVVHSGSTPGLRLAKLKLDRFDGTPANLRLRRWRVLASLLSALSLGMGYAWVFLDEDALCWHDRITHTYLAPAASARKPND